MRAEFAALVTPTALGIMAGTLAVWGASQFFGIGEIIDAILVVVGAIFLGKQIFDVAAELLDVINITRNATTQSDLDQAASHLAKVVAMIGVAALVALLMKGAGKGASKLAPRIRASLARAAAVAESRLGGMTRVHFSAFQEIAQKEGRILAVRNTNRACTPLIERGFPPKPIEIKIKTSKSSGIVTAGGTRAGCFCRGDAGGTQCGVFRGRRGRRQTGRQKRQGGDT